MQGVVRRNAQAQLLQRLYGVDDARHQEIQFLSVGRPSLYNALPELLFHPIDRFDNLSPTDDKDKFEEEYDAQEREKDQAHKFFAPFDLMLLRLRMMVRERLDVYAETDKIMIDILGDEITETQKQNRFVKKVLPFLPLCKSIRGNKTYLTLMLRKIFLEEGLTIDIGEQKHSFTDAHPQYNAQLGSDFDDFYLGNTYMNVGSFPDIRSSTALHQSHKFRLIIVTPIIKALKHIGPGSTM